MAMSPRTRDVAEHLWRNQGPRINFRNWSGGFFAPDRTFLRRQQMDKRELAFAKQAVLATRDWDTYRAIIRRCLRVPENDRKTLKKSHKL